MEALSLRKRLLLLRDLCSIAMAEGKAMHEEFGILEIIASYVGVKSQLINDVFTGVYKGFD